MTQIHPTAIVSSEACLADDVEVGPFAIIEPEVTLGPGCRIAARATVKSRTQIGAGTVIHEGAIVGGIPQHLQGGEPGRLVIGKQNVIRENVTIHLGLHADDVTSIGDHNFIMVNSHIAHDCEIGSHCVIANNVMLAGHIAIEDRAYLSGAVAVHQFVRIGAFAMVGGQAHIKRDVPPFVTVDGFSSTIVGLNKVGLRRNGYTREEMAQLKEAYRLIYRSGSNWQDTLAALGERFPEYPARRYFEFFSGGKRGFMQERRSPPAATLRMPTADDADQPTRRAG
ncbi:acyl-ACP--UDP-N-acetylglucosamine O-acyltransferase [Lignipirellula cremea]|uniref:Acyl-[acyl-carrier-protein]--UDP-N-acetylglucosamine O-acyltransferase n=1 Tax=Lignipirellula cremea TaxID=2528010 RepID=A0A518E0W0_9BACT|nr:acyl-ACP--UDP-N-acetylglucosamine O-acyltransferase [Lignipirellula cremea]QDU97730.1 Acyl-[acyl-carrier-protein]--UDP-N-acetylglucosamine O-acyltransferase [Lignipirellula cremea]